MEEGSCGVGAGLLGAAAAALGTEVLGTEVLGMETLGNGREAAGAGVISGDESTKSTGVT